MNRDETIALFERCEAARAATKAHALAEGKSEYEARAAAHEAAKAVWNGWADDMLAKRKALEDAGRWAAEQETWRSAAEANFIRCHFLVGEAQVTADEDKVRSAPLEPPVKAISVRDSAIGFSSFLFPGNAWFVGAIFSGKARFDSTTFSSNARFDGASFSGSASFDSARFSGRVWFDSASFSGDARFDCACFSGDASFNSARLSSDARFGSARFSGNAFFEAASVFGDASFENVRFSGDAWFAGVTFTEVAQFENTTFSGDAGFGSATFAGITPFDRATFSGTAWFDLSKFERHASFDAVHFHGPASFDSIRGERGFSMAEARFENVPDFIQAHFEEAPRLDNVRVVGRMIASRVGEADVTKPILNDASIVRRQALRDQRMLWKWRSVWHRIINYARRWIATASQRLKGSVVDSDELRGMPVGWRAMKRLGKQDREWRDIPVRWRALKRLAIQAHDEDREHEFFAQEMRSARFAVDWPFPWPIRKAEGWLGCARFYFGYLYCLFSNYGRSIAKPLFWWSTGIVIAAIFYLGEQDGMAGNRAVARFWGEPSLIAYLTTSYGAWRWDRDCFEPRGEPKNIEAGKVGVVALSDQLRAKTSAPWEAFQLALRDGFLILYGDADTAHRTYGCLYGIELYSNSTPIAIVPPEVGLFSAFHKLYSAVMIFLFGLALRNMLKMK